MKLKLKEPYKSDYKSAYCYKNKEPRRVVSLIKESGERTCTSYARYLMSSKLGRYLNDDEHVDHKDDNALNDDLSNLQILTEEENRSKHVENLKRKWVKMRCAVCENIFDRKHNKTFLGKSSNKNYQTCSRSCGGRASHMNKEILIDNFELINIYYK